MRVISLKPQGTLITSGPYRFTRNPPYLGGNVFIFFGAALFFGSPTALVATALHLPLMDRFIRREEEQLERRFGEEWRTYEAACVDGSRPKSSLDETVPRIPVRAPSPLDHVPAGCRAKWFEFSRSELCRGWG